MRSLIVGTAGHIDHGKSALVQALTGTDPDRLQEEKERGITIDLGFAHLDLGAGRVASFIDVPGHERFVRNMLAGAHGIDAVVLVVAADESVMPQTREHFHICRLLDIRAGIVALTKCDIADSDSQALAEMETRELVAGSFLEEAPLVRVSARTGLGLDALRQALASLADRLRPRADQGLLRLPIDRVFTMRGFGTVVTGTLVSGSLSTGQELEVLPGGLRARVRGLQVHGAAVGRLEAGNRAAVNLAGVEVADLQRGDVLALPETLRPTSMLDVRLSLLPGEKPLRDQVRVRVHVASAEVMARVHLLEPEGPGALRAQLRLERPVVAGRGDHLVLRSYSPAVTIGGATVEDPLPPKRRGRRVAARPTERSEGPASAARRILDEAGPRGVDAPTLAARLTLAVPALLELLASADDVLALGRDPVWFVSRPSLDALAEDTRALLEAFHAKNPLKAAMPREEVRRRLFDRVPEGGLEHVLGRMAAAGEVRLSAETVALARHAVRLSPEEQAAREWLAGHARAAGLQGLAGELPPDAPAGPLRERISRLLVDEGLLRRVGETLVHRDALNGLTREVRGRWPPGSRLDVGAFKDLTGLSRKFVIPLLEYLDRERVTRRSGNERLVLAPVGEAVADPREAPGRQRE